MEELILVYRLDGRHYWSLTGYFEKLDVDVRTGLVGLMLLLITKLMQRAKVEEARHLRSENLMYVHSCVADLLRWSLHLETNWNLLSRYRYLMARLGSALSTLVACRLLIARSLSVGVEQSHLRRTSKHRDSCYEIVSGRVVEVMGSDSELWS